MRSLIFTLLLIACTSASLVENEIVFDKCEYCKSVGESLKVLLKTLVPDKTLDSLVETVCEKTGEFKPYCTIALKQLLEVVHKEIQAIDVAKICKLIKACS
ncbi:unnamed protein product [Calicophoron daubneyi]|uniref:Saposin B-type domain-containing protein n=1 Tax=Calicophoron daubneyi TaxID=300641 RepID=A0AAV2T964_CALDB